GGSLAPIPWAGGALLHPGGGLVCVVASSVIAVSMPVEGRRARARSTGVRGLVESRDFAERSRAIHAERQPFLGADGHKILDEEVLVRICGRHPDPALAEHLRLRVVGA